MDRFELICELIIALAGTVPAIVSLVCLILNIVKNKNWTLLTDMAKSAMSSVEEYAKDHPEMTSDDKLNMALNSIKEAAAVASIKINDDTIKRIITYIKDMCAWSKTVNTDNTSNK